MDADILRKVIESTGESCPPFKYKIPLLDKNIADLLARALIKKLDSNEIPSQRIIILKIIRKLCRVAPDQHVNIEDDEYEEILNAYKTRPANCSIDEALDDFLIRNLKELYIGSLHSPSFTPELIQALLNLEEDKGKIYDMILKDVIHWNVDDENSQYLDILKTMWNFESFDGCTNIEKKKKLEYGDISIKLKPLIEKTLLESIAEMLKSKVIVDEEWFCAKKDIERLVQICSVSSECFQICCSIMNAIFIKTKFSKLMIQYIKLFLKAVKSNKEYISELYPCNLQNIVILLDIDINGLGGELRETYIKHALDDLNKLHGECESDVIMLLSHFNQWFDIYYKSNQK